MSCQILGVRGLSRGPVSSDVLDWGHISAHWVRLCPLEGSARLTPAGVLARQRFVAAPGARVLFHIPASRAGISVHAQARSGWVPEPQWDL
eukprot:265917-Pyramimonas_sp.AAC.1